MKSQSTIFVIGNGPSLRDFDFRRLDACHTLGMNAAYRHWDRIGWYPTYYCCLDDQLILTHHEEIKRLVEKEQVRGAFVHGSFLELHPECVGDARFWSFDQFHPYWYRNRGKATGRAFIDAPAFHTGDTSKVTTGAYAVRFCAHLGYETIGLLGIDLRYVELIPEAEKAEGIALRIKETPAHNPNYFFDDYQRAGDRYNIPNPDAHQGDLHPRSFQVLRDDFHANRIATRVVNCNPASILADRAVFPFVPVEDVLGEPKLGSVVVPCTPGEKEQLLANFKLWAKPAFAPMLSHAPARRPKLAFVLNRAPDGLQRDLEAAFHEQGMERYFSGIDVHSLELTGESDAYVRSYDRPSGPQGYKAGPNNQFFGTMRIARRYGLYAFLMESDCVPIRPDWLARLQQIVEGAEPFFIMGSAYRGVAEIASSFSRHINGNAVYAVGDPDFVSFLDEHWEPELRRAVEKDDRRFAYDCILEVCFNAAESQGGQGPRWSDVAHKLRYTDYIQNISAKDDIEAASGDLVRRILLHHRNTHIVHSQAVAVAARRLLEQGQHVSPDALEPSSGSAKAAPAAAPARAKALTFTGRFADAPVESRGDGYVIPPGSADQYVMLKFAGKVEPGDTVAGHLKFRVQSDGELSVMLCRDGTGAFEGSRTIGFFRAGEHTVPVRHKFNGSFDGVRIQVGAEKTPASFEMLSASLETLPVALAGGGALRMLKQVIEKMK